MKKICLFLVMALSLTMLAGCNVTPPNNNSTEYNLELLTTNYSINDDEESRAFYCEVIMDEAAKMNEMVKKLLTLNQLESGNDITTMERFDITEMISAFVQSADILARQSGIQVKIDGERSCYVWADEYKTEEVVRNYFSNAMNHCEGEKIIHIKTQRNGEKVRVSVFNTGMPIPEDALSHIWEKFYNMEAAG